MRKITGKWLEDPTAQALLQGLSDAGHEGYFVGGCVRNALLKQAVTDLDISTSARPEEVMQIARALGLKPVPTGIEHGTVTVVGGAEPLEVTTFRRDVVTDGRRAIVAFSDRLEEDAARRDFRMNAIYADTKGALQDPMAGLQDIEARQLVFVGVASERIREDYLRIVRLYRFAAQLGFGAAGIDGAASRAAARLSYGLEQVSAERKTAEMLKLLTAPQPCDVLHKMAEDGVLARVIGGVNLPVLERYVAMEERPDARARLAAMTISDSVQRLRLSKVDQRFVEEVTALSRTELALAEMAYRKGADTALAAVRIRVAMRDESLMNDAVKVAQAAEKKKFPVAARDLSNLQGAALGAMLKQLEQAWIDSEFTLSKTNLLNEL